VPNAPRRPSRRWRACLFIGAGSIAAGVLWSGPAGAEQCQPQPNPGYKVEVAVEIPPVGVLRHLSRSELGEMAHHGPSEQVLGVTATRLEAETTTYFGGHTADGGVCLWVERIHLALRYSALDIYVASEYAPTSCPYKAVLKHERRHEDVARHHLKGYIEQIRSALSSLAIPKARKPVFATSLETGQAKVRSTLERLLEPVAKKIRRTMGEAQAKVDSRGEYQRVRKQCNNW
jgi:hypothetical protein